MDAYAKISLEQWQVFCAVVEEGSYAKATEQLNKSQSSVSYVIAKMHERLPAPALVIVGRKAELTDLGKLLYRQARALLNQALAIDQTARYHASGWQSEIVIAADALTPMHLLFCALHAFSELSPSTRVRILETSLSGTDEALLERKAHLAISPHVPPGFLSEALWQITMLPVVSKNHPLAQASSVSENELIRERQIVVRDSGTKRERESGWLASDQRWTVSHFSSSVDAVKEGLGFAFIPKERISNELESGELCVLALSIPARRVLCLNLIVADQSNAGPAVNALVEILRANAKV